jgi:hypothetical protein
MNSHDQSHSQSFKKPKDYLLQFSEILKSTRFQVKLDETPPAELVEVLNRQEFTVVGLENLVAALTSKANNHFDELINGMTAKINKLRNQLISSYNEQIQTMKTNFQLYNDKIKKYYGGSTSAHHFEDLVKNVNNCSDSNEYALLIKKLNAEIDDVQIIKNSNDNVKEDVYRKLLNYNKQMLHSLNFIPKIKLEDFSASLLEPLMKTLEKSILDNMQLTAKVEPVAMSSCDIKSSIIKQADELMLIQRWLGLQDKDVTFELLYQGSKDKFIAKTFHAKVDPHEHTLVVARTNKKKIFGGYSDQTWKTNQGESKYSKVAFIFDLTNKMKYKINPGNEDFAIKPLAKMGPSFGHKDFICCLSQNKQAIQFYPDHSYGKKGMQNHNLPNPQVVDEGLEELEVFKINYEGIQEVQLYKQANLFPDTRINVFNFGDPFAAPGGFGFNPSNLMCPMLIPNPSNDGVQNEEGDNKEDDGST